MKKNVQTSVRVERSLSEFNEASFEERVSIPVAVSSDRSFVRIESAWAGERSNVDRMWRLKRSVSAVSDRLKHGAGLVYIPD